MKATGTVGESGYFWHTMPRRHTGAGAKAADFGGIAQARWLLREIAHGKTSRYVFSPPLCVGQRSGGWQPVIDGGAATLEESAIADLHPARAVLPHMYRRSGVRQLVHQGYFQLPEDAGLCLRRRQGLSALAWLLVLLEQRLDSAWRAEGGAAKG